MQHHVATGDRIEFADAHRAGVGEVNRVFCDKPENPDVGNWGINREVGPGPARIHRKLVEILERNVRREIDRAVNRPQHQQVKPSKSQCATRRTGGDSIHTDQAKLCHAVVARVDGRIAGER